jgi:hypothetical protein
MSTNSELSKKLLELCNSEKFKSFVTASNSNNMETFFLVKNYIDKVGDDNDFHYEPVQFLAYFSDLLGQLDPSESEISLGQIKTGEKYKNLIELQKFIFAASFGSNGYKDEFGTDDFLTYSHNSVEPFKVPGTPDQIKTSTVNITNIKESERANYNIDLEFGGLPYLFNVPELNVLPKLIQVSGTNIVPIKSLFLYLYLLIALSDLSKTKENLINIIGSNCQNDEGIKLIRDAVKNNLTHELINILPNKNKNDLDGIFNYALKQTIQYVIDDLSIIDSTVSEGLKNDISNKYNEYVINLTGTPPVYIGKSDIDRVIKQNMDNRNAGVFNVILNNAYGLNTAYLSGANTWGNEIGTEYPILKGNFGGPGVKDTALNDLNNYYNAEIGGVPVTLPYELILFGGANNRNNAYKNFITKITTTPADNNINLKTTNINELIDKMTKILLWISMVNTASTQWGKNNFEITPGSTSGRVKKMDNNYIGHLLLNFGNAPNNIHADTITKLKHQIKFTLKTLMEKIIPRLWYIKEILINNIESPIFENKLKNALYAPMIERLTKLLEPLPINITLNRPTLKNASEWFMCMMKNQDNKKFFEDYFNIIDRTNRLNVSLNNIIDYKDDFINGIDLNNYYVNAKKIRFSTGGFDILFEKINNQYGGVLPTLLIFSKLPSINPNNSVWLLKNLPIKANKLKEITEPNRALEYIVRQFFKRSVIASASGLTPPTIRIIPDEPKINVNDIAIFKNPKTVLTLPFLLSTEDLFREIEEQMFGISKKEELYSAEKFLDELEKLWDTDGRWERSGKYVLKLTKNNQPAQITSTIDQACQFIDDTICGVFLQSCIREKKQIDDKNCRNLILEQNVFQIRNNDEPLKVGEVVKQVHKLNPAYAVKILKFFKFGIKKSTIKHGIKEVSIDKVETVGSWLNYIKKNYDTVGGKYVVDKIIENRDLNLYLDILVNYVNAHPKVLNLEYTGKEDNIDINEADDALKMNSMDFKIFKYMKHKNNTRDTLSELERLKSTLLNNVTGPSSTYMLEKSKNMAKDWALNPIILNPLPYGIPLSIKQKGGGLYDGLIDITIRREPGRYSNDQFEEKLKKGFNDQNNNYGAAMLKELIDYAQELLSKGGKFKMSDQTYEELTQKIGKLEKIEGKITKIMGYLVIKRRVYNQSRGLVDLSKIKDDEFLSRLLKKHQKFADLTDAYRKKSVNLITVLQHLYKIIEEKVDTSSTERKEVDYPVY